MRLDALIFGGGAAGLWLLDRLVRRGCHVLLLEAHALGAGQTVSSQGIIHGGLKYTLQGMLTPAAKSIRGMPLAWRHALLGRTAPNLTHTQVRSDCCYLWQTDSLSSRLGMLGARLGLHITPEPVADHERPAALAQLSTSVVRLPEQVISPHSFISDLATQYRDHLLQIDAEQGVDFELNSPGEIDAVRLTAPGTGQTWRVCPRHVIFTAGSGNAALRQRAKLDSQVMQRRPLQMAMVRGPLPWLNGHCVDGAKTRVTITSDTDSSGRTVWQVGGQVAEDGVGMTSGQLQQHVCQELQQVLPGVSFNDCEWSSYRVDRAEGQTTDGRRPETVQMLCAGNVTTGWPTKLALAPVLAEAISARVTPRVSAAAPLDVSSLADWPRPAVALPPWEERSASWTPTRDLPSRPGITPAERRAA
jgi:glycerol-3-phosphate dehydrogenase